MFTDAVFGNHLHRICDRDGCNVPKFVDRMLNAIEMRGETIIPRVTNYGRNE